MMFKIQILEKKSPLHTDAEVTHLLDLYFSKKTQATHFEIVKYPTHSGLVSTYMSSCACLWGIICMEK